MKPTGLFLLLMVICLTFVQPVQAELVSAEDAPEPAALVGTPVLVEPHKNQKTIDRPAFIWAEVPGATKYTLEIKRVADNVVAHKATYASSVRCSDGFCTVILNTALPLTDYKWHVLAYDVVGKGDWSLYYTFTTWQTTLPQAALRSPGVDAVVYGGRPTFKWYPTTGADSYYLQLVDAAHNEIGFWTASSSVCGTYCEFRIPVNLNSNYGDYSWRVQALDTADMVVGSWSNWRDFTYTRIMKSDQIGPANGATTGDHQPTFEFSAVEGATFYVLEVLDAASDHLYYRGKILAGTICGADECSVTIDNMLAGGEYKWHVRGLNGTNFGYWSPWWTFTMSGSTATYTNDFTANPTDWIDPDSRWEWDTAEYYMGFPSAVCWHHCATTYYPQNYTNATFTIRLSSNGGDADDGYKIMWRALYGTGGDLIQAYELEVTQEGSDMLATIRRYYEGTVYNLGSQAISSQSITNPHTVVITLNENAFTLSYNGFGMGTFDVMREDYYYGVFSIDVTSPPGGTHSVMIDEVSIDVPGT